MRKGVRGIFRDKNRKTARESGGNTLLSGGKSHRADNGDDLDDNEESGAVVSQPPRPGNQESTKTQDLLHNSDSPARPVSQSSDSRPQTSKNAAASGSEPMEFGNFDAVNDDLAAGQNDKAKSKTNSPEKISSGDRADDASSKKKSSSSPDRKSTAKKDNKGNLTVSVMKSKNIAESAGTHRLNRILNKTQRDDDHNAADGPGALISNSSMSSGNQKYERINDPKDMDSVGRFVARLVLPPLKVDTNSIGGASLESYPPKMKQETLLCYRCQQFESTGNETVTMSALQYPSQYTSHKRRLGLLSSVGTKARNKYRYVIIARSSNSPVIPEAASLISLHDGKASPRNDTGEIEEGGDEESNRGDYDTMFAPEDESEIEADGDSSTGSHPPNSATAAKRPTTLAATGESKDALAPEEDEASSFPVLICMTLNSDGSAPDVRKLIPLDQLTTVQNLQSTAVQLAFRSGDTIRIDFGDRDGDEDKAAERSMDKERFIWSLLQIHAMLCTAVVERASHMAGTRDRIYLPPLNVRNLDRAELQYVATVNGFLGESEVLQKLLDRQRRYIEEDGPSSAGITTTTAKGSEKVELEEMDSLAYAMMMGNFNTRVSLFQSENEKKDAEEVLNSTEWTKNSLPKEETTAVVSVAEKIGLMLQMRMRDLEAETCRRLIAWEDEKHYSSSGGAKVMSNPFDDRETVDALALASLFKMLDSLDQELEQMEYWLQERAAAIKPLTDDCAGIEEENRQLEQQWKSYDMLGLEMKRLLQGLEINAETEKVLKNPASALSYDSDGRVMVKESEEGIEKIYRAGKALLEAIEYPKKSGGMHLKAVNERCDHLDEITKGYCTALAQIIVTVMEQYKTDVVAESDHGKVSKNDTHSTIAKKIRDTQKKFQSALLGYIKPIEVLAALSPDMLPALRDAYAEMVSEGILMKKRCKGYFQALPGKNAAYMNRAGKDIKDYVPFEVSREEGVNAPDIRGALSELLPVIAREAYFTSALFGSNTKDHDGREKKRNFENTRAAVDNASQHFRYYINRSCGINSDDSSGKATAEMSVKGDPLLNLVASICLNEAMESYIDHEKKGGDHSLSLAYVRATILDLRKRADKQWVVWVEKQMEWIRSNDGVPPSGKRAGVFPSFARFPCYLDHVLMCCREGRDEDYVPDMAHIKVINYYLQKLAATLLESLKDCATRESTDKEYASDVMQMENTFFFTQSIKQRGPAISDLFGKQVTKANAITKESTDAYLGWMIKKEFTALHELFTKLSKIRKEYGDKEVPEHVPKQLFVKTLTKEASREVLKERITSMNTRMGKHLSEEGGLIPVAWKALVKVLFEWFGRWEKLSSSIYKHKLDPGALDVVRIAKAAGGGSKPRATAGNNEFGFKTILALKNRDKV
ncbi:hypothetical protein ACA910_008645 [Epithemia clementina (nom. ined.)]